MLNETYKLANGVLLPKLGFGTWLLDDQAVVPAVKQALDLGYRHIDTAAVYGNEAGVGQAIRESSVAREDIFVTTKILAEIKDYDGAVAAVDESLDRMGLEYLDLILIHAPKPWADYTGTDGFAAGNLAAWQGLEAAYQAGKVRAIGVANFDQADLQNLLDHGTVAPMVDQVLAHIGKTPLDLIDFAQNHDILVEAHSPFGHGDLVSNSDLQAIAGTYGVTVPQLAVRYLLQLGLAPLPKATSADHMRSNAAIDFVISDADMAKLKAWTGFHYSDETSVFPVYQK